MLGFDAISVLPISTLPEEEAAEAVVHEVGFAGVNLGRLLGKR